LFLKTLEKDPENLIAKTGLINIRAAGPSNLSAGSELKQLLIEHPKQAHLHASLGNFHAQRSEWPAAQAAYFEAFALDSTSPDYAFNLAISLDQIGKPEIAANYYKKAIELFGSRPSQFSRADAERRLEELKGFNELNGLKQLEGTAP
jgi:Flp pilus assembly protein TadD